jgi:hypothetical protein
MTPGVGNSLQHALESLSYTLLAEAGGCHDPELLGLYLVVLEHPSLLDPAFSQVSYLADDRPVVQGQQRQ